MIVGCEDLRPGDLIIAATEDGVKGYDIWPKTKYPILVLAVSKTPMQSEKNGWEVEPTILTRDGELMINQVTFSTDVFTIVRSQCPLQSNCCP